MPEVLHRFTNELANEKSPYLLQHAHNPVQWKAWNEVAFETARREDKPVFLSIGYSTCHWCHVMENESFEDLGVAHILNEHYISIKLDREERPDIDAVYMEVCQAMTGHGGWPLTIIMMPDKKPFFSGTYFPKNSTHGRAGLVDILEKIAGLWNTDRRKLIESSEYVYSTLQQNTHHDMFAEFSPEILNDTVEKFRQIYDTTYGGFRQSPKFPSPHQLCFLLRMYHSTRDESVLEMVTTTLTKMRMGGIFDHIGLGFHRYSTDERWFLPHFEKMLYDQAWLAIAYTEAYQVTQSPLFKQTAEDILTYVEESLTSPEGAFYSAEDADSEGVEGKYYVWKYDELIAILGEEDGLIFTEVYGIEKAGNFRDEATGTLSSENIPYLKIPLQEYALNHSMEIEYLESKLKSIRSTLSKERTKRIHPIVDDKILTDWNGMMIAALAKAACAFQEPKYLLRAEKAWNFLSSKMLTSDGELLHRYRDNDASITGFLDDYAAIAFGLFEMYQAGGKREYLDISTKLSERLLAKFEDEKGGFHQVEKHSEDTPFTGQKIIYDGAYPSGNSMAILTLLKLGTLLQRKDFTESAIRAIYSSGTILTKYSTGLTWLLSSVHYVQSKRSELILCGDSSTSLWEEFTSMIQTAFLPSLVRLYQEDAQELIQLTRPTSSIVMICEDYSCKLPITSSGELTSYLQMK
ncbi:MAG: thioredoxin domain-containing protein [Ignavibacteria bacterium]|nr:thioredoxin domain-containing protein [Ignavibacteria bacterium]